ncbi:hypothetical protein POM88_033674 [Heracleum sosnowskyi]|uniref:Uncharacterized protein n=1 Tax=Heracleum sosnowskyi TaxID=360622 RepID=A0AAD8HHU0_9APIA|nr:hypothetical protein POM88_033674 [Heracleum sosnowskyi]
MYYVRGILNFKKLMFMDVFLCKLCGSASYVEIVAYAPGKVLMTGGYLILERPNVGLVLSTNARFYAIVKPFYDQFKPDSWAWSITAVDQCEWSDIHTPPSAVDQCEWSDIHTPPSNTLKSLSDKGETALLFQLDSHWFSPSVCEFGKGWSALSVAETKYDNIDLSSEFHDYDPADSCAVSVMQPTYSFQEVEGSS